jgi:hypothetical protein
MVNGMVLFGKSLIRSFGITTAQRIATLMNKRNEILREYYWSIRNSVCFDGNCYVLESIQPNTSRTQMINSIDNKTSQEYCEKNLDDFLDKQNEFTHDYEEKISLPSIIVRPIFPINNRGYKIDTQDDYNSSDEIIDIDGNQSRALVDSIRSQIEPGYHSYIPTLDVTAVTQRKLEDITREITDNIAASFHIRDVNQTSNKNRPIIHFQRLFNLLSMYDKELINQAKSYAFFHYDISMNCAQSSLEITNHLSDELNILMNESSQIVKNIS